MVRLLALLSLLFVVGCQSESLLRAGGYKMIQLNNPECMGQSGSGILLIKEEGEQILNAQINQKTGYCEAITGQVISTGGQALGDYFLKQGLQDSGGEANITQGSGIVLPNLPPNGGDPDNGSDNGHSPPK